MLTLRVLFIIVALLLGLFGVFFVFCFFFWLFAFSRAIPAAYRSSQATGLIGAVAAGLHYSHSNMGSKLRL